MDRNSPRSTRSRPIVSYAESINSEDSNEESIVSTDEDGGMNQDEFDLDEMEDEDHQNRQKFAHNSSIVKGYHEKVYKHEISSETATKRASFFIAKKDSFLPLLPAANLIEKLIERRQFSGHALRDKTVAYQKLEKQPDG